MAKAHMVKELNVKTENKVGMLSEVSQAIASEGVNIVALNAYAVDNEAFFRIVTTDNTKAAEGLKARSLEAHQRDVISVELDNSVGKAGEMGAILKDKGIDVTYIYGSTCDCGGPCTIIVQTGNNAEALSALNG